MRHLAQSLVIAIIYGLLDLGLERGLLTQNTVQNVATLLFRVLTIVTRVYPLLVIPTSPIEHNLLERESKQQRLYSIAAYYTSKCLTDSTMFIIMVFLGICKTLFSQEINKCKSSANSKDLISYTDLLLFIFVNNLL